MSDTIYQRGNIMGKKGTILPRSADLGKEHSGTVFDVNRPLEQNIVEMDANGRQVVHHLDADAVARATQAARAGKTVDPTRFGKRVNEPVSPTYHRVVASAPLDSDISEPTTGLPFVIQDDSRPPFEEYPEIPAAMEASPKSESLPKSGGSDGSPPASIPATPLQTGAHAPASEVEKLSAPEPKRVIEAYEPVIERPADLDKEPDAAPGPERLSSYTVERRTSPTDVVPPPLLVPQMESAPMKTSAVNEPFMNTKSVEKGPKTISYANLEAAPMRKAKVKVRFKSAMGSLAVAYNVVFKEGIKLVMVQHDVEGLFYEPPGDNETPVEIQWHGDTYVCYSALNFKMPDEQTAFNIYLIDVEATARLGKG
jgi:hypothetical protein